MESNARFTGVKIGRSFRRSIISCNDNVSGAIYSLRGNLKYGNHYQYKPLNGPGGEIRLLYLQPGLPNDPLRCSLKHVQIAVAQDSQLVPEYEALSYAWGNPTPCKTCIIDGIRVKIPNNTALALRRFRMPETIRVLWVDALCINQDDIIERGEQVTLMARIYKHCKRCLVWLGKGSSQAKDAFTTIHKILEAAARSPDRFPKKLQMMQQTDVYHYLGFPIGLQFDPKPLEWLFTRPWFSRKWTIQEATIPDDVICYCGPFEISLIDLAQVAICLMTKHFPKDNITLNNAVCNIFACYYPPLMYKEHVSSGAMRLNIGGVLEVTRESKVSDPRDSIYAILGLFQVFVGPDQDIIDKLLRPDYQRPISNVLCRAAKASIYHDKHLRLLGHVNQRLGADLLGVVEDIPSWVPLWHIDIEERLMTSFDSMCVLFDASSGLEVVSQPFDANHFEDDLKLLYCKSTVIDTVSHVREYLDPEALGKPQEIKKLILWLWKHIQKQSSPYQCEDGKFALKALALTLMAGKGYTTFGVADKEEIDAFAAFVKAIMLPVLPEILQPLPNQGSIDSKLLIATPEQQELLCSLGAMRRAATHRVAFVTERGITGMGPSNMQIGDSLVLLHGCSWPAILRPKQDGYEFLEVCYAHGYMWGPKHWIPGIDLKETTLTIR